MSAYCFSLASILIVTADDTATSKLSEAKQFYIQNSRTVEHPMYSLNGTALLRDVSVELPYGTSSHCAFAALPRQSCDCIRAETQLE